MSDLNEQQEYIDLCKEIVLKHIPKDKYDVFIFGSRVKPSHRFAADIDIGILGNEPVPNILISNLEEKLKESKIPFEVDLVDFYSVDEKFKQKALKQIEFWNQKS